MQVFTSEEQGPLMGTTINSENIFQQALDRINAFRKEHNSPPLQYDEKLAKYANRHAKTLAKHPKCKLKKSHHTDLGESIYKEPNSYPILKKIPNVAIDAVNDWHSEKSEYDFSKPGFTRTAVHFTQMVWEETTAVGFGGAQNSDTDCIVIVAMYEPAGNYALDYEKNVHQQT